MDALLESFISQYAGKTGVGDTPENINQCVGLIECWLDTIKYPHIWGNAVDLLTNADPSHYAITYNNPTNYPVAGDIIVFGSPYGQGTDAEGKTIYYGHTGVVVKADVNNVTVFQQNDPLHSTPHMQTYTYDACLGWLHPVTQNVPVPSLPPVDSHGLDLHNPESLQVALDTWYAVASGKYVSLDKYEALQNQQTDTQKLLTAANQQLIDVMKDNKTVHDMLSSKEGQDATSLESALQLQKEYQNLQQAMTDIAKALDINKTDTGSIISRILVFKDLADKRLRMMQYQRQAVQAVVTKASSVWDRFMALITNTPDGEGVSK